MDAGRILGEWRGMQDCIGKHLLFEFLLERLMVWMGTLQCREEQYMPRLMIFMACQAY